MTTYTNRHGVPDALARAVVNDTYDPGDCDITNTQLIGPPRIAALKRQLGDQITEDVADCLYRLQGQAMHVILERAADPARTFVEERIYIERGGWRIGMQFDLVTIEGPNHASLKDWKWTSIYTVKDGAKAEWEAQLNVLRLGIREQMHIDIRELSIEALLRDWSKRKARRDKDHPKHGWLHAPVKLWPLEQTEAYIAERVRLHQDARETLPECTQEERWATPDTWAVIRTGGKRATRVLESEAAAQAYMIDKKMGWRTKAGGFIPAKGREIEYRPGESIRCADYCAVAPFCAQARSLGVVKLLPDAEAVTV